MYRSVRLQLLGWSGECDIADAFKYSSTSISLGAQGAVLRAPPVPTPGGPAQVPLSKVPTEARPVGGPGFRRRGAEPWGGSPYQGAGAPPLGPPANPCSSPVVSAATGRPGRGAGCLRLHPPTSGVFSASAGSVRQILHWVVSQRGPGRQSLHCSAGRSWWLRVRDDRGCPGGPSPQLR